MLEYLPREINNARVLMVVKAYPQPSTHYDELVCTAGLLNGEKWIRIYPIPYRLLTDDEKFPKWAWIRLNLVKAETDFRPESYRPKLGLQEQIHIEEIITSKDSHHWEIKKSYCFSNEVFKSMDDLIQRSKNPENKSIGMVKPKKIIDLRIDETAREWPEKWINTDKEGNLFADEELEKYGRPLKEIRKIPYKFIYRYQTEDGKERDGMIEDWELGALYWKCFRRHNGNEQLTIQDVKKKFFTWMNDRDIHLIMGSTWQHHNKRAHNPFVVIGIFYPPIDLQPELPW